MHIFGSQGPHSKCAMWRGRQVWIGMSVVPVVRSCGQMGSCADRCARKACGCCGQVWQTSMKGALPQSIVPNPRRHGRKVVQNLCALLIKPNSEQQCLDLLAFTRL